MPCQDLNDLSVLGKDHPEELNAIKFDMTILDEAAALADGMSDLLGATTTERADSSDTKKIRDQAYTYLKEAVDEVRDFGQYVFWRDDARFRGYRSEYMKRANARSRSKKKPVEVSAV